MQVKFTKVNKVTAGQEMEDLWGGQSIPWSRCKCHYLMKKHCSTSLQPTKPSNAEHVFCSLLLIWQNTIWPLEGILQWVVFSLVILFVTGANWPHWKLMGGNFSGDLDAWWSHWRLWTQQASWLCWCSFLWVLQSFQGQGIQNEESQCWHAMMAPLTKLTIRYSYLLSMHSLLKGEPYGIKEKPMFGMRTGIYTDVPSLLWSTHGVRYGAQGTTYDNQASELHFDFKDWWSHKQPVSLWICPAWHKCWAKNRQ